MSPIRGIPSIVSAERSYVHRNQENMAVNNQARRRKEKLRKRARGAIKKAHTLHILREADVALIVIMGGKCYEYRSDDTTTWLPAPQIVRLSLNSVYIRSNTDATLEIWKPTTKISPFLRHRGYRQYFGDDQPGGPYHTIFRTKGILWSLSK